MEEKMKSEFTILHGQCTESLISKIRGDSKYESTEHDQDVIIIMKLINGVIFKFDKNKELAHVIWEAYVPVFQCRQK